MAEDSSGQVEAEISAKKKKGGFFRRRNANRNSVYEASGTSLLSSAVRQNIERARERNSPSTPSSLGSGSGSASGSRESKPAASQTSLTLEFSKVFQLALDLRIATLEQVSYLLEAEADALGGSGGSASSASSSGSASGSSSGGGNASPNASGSGGSGASAALSSSPSPLSPTPLARSRGSSSTSKLTKKRGIRNLGSIMSAFVLMPNELNMNWSEIFHYRMVEAQNVLAECHVDIIHQLATSYLQSLSADEKKPFVVRPIEVPFCACALSLSPSTLLHLQSPNLHVTCRRL